MFFLLLIFSLIKIDVCSQINEFNLESDFFAQMPSTLKQTLHVNPNTEATEGIVYDRVAKSMYYSEASGGVREFPWSAKTNVTYDWNRNNIGRGPIGRIVYSDPNCESGPSDDCLLWTLGLEVFYRRNQIIINTENGPIFDFVEQSYLIIAANNNFFPANDGTQQCAVIIKNMQTKKTYKINVPSRDLINYPCFANDVTITSTTQNNGIWVSDMIGYQTSYIDLSFDNWGNITHSPIATAVITDPKYTSASGELIPYDPTTAREPGGHQFQGTNGMEVLNPITHTTLGDPENRVFYMAAWPTKMTRVEIINFSPIQVKLNLVTVDYVSEIQGFDGLIMINGSDALGDHRILHTGSGLPGHGNNVYKVVDNVTTDGNATFKVLMKVQPEIAPGQAKVCTTVAHNINTDEIATICNNEFGPPPYNTASYTSKRGLAIASSRPQMRFTDFSYSNRAIEYHEELDMVLLGSSSHTGIGVVGIPNALTENDFTADYPSEYDVARFFTPQDVNKKCNQIIYMQINPANKCHLWMLCSTFGIDATSYDQSYPQFNAATDDVGLGMVDICDLIEPKTIVDWYVPLSINNNFGGGVPMSFAISPNSDNTVDIFVLEQTAGITRVYDVYTSTANTNPRVEVAIYSTDNVNNGLAGVAVDWHSQKLIWMTQNDGNIYVQSITNSITSLTADTVIRLGTTLGNQSPTRLPQGIKFNSDSSYLFVPTGSPSATEETWVSAVKFGENWESATIAARFHLDCRQPKSDYQQNAKTVLDFPTAVIFPRSNLDYNLHDYENQSPYGEDLLMLCSGQGYLESYTPVNEYVTMVKSANYMTTLTNNIMKPSSVCTTMNNGNEDDENQDDIVIGLAVAFSIMSVVVIFMISQIYFSQSSLSGQSRPSMKGRPSNSRHVPSSTTENPMTPGANNL